MNDKSKEKSLDFEKSLEKLENIIEALEDGDLPLNESIKTFEEGVKLTKHCQELLTKAELKIQKLLEKDDGSLDLEDFDDKYSRNFRFKRPALFKQKLKKDR